MNEHTDTREINQIWETYCDESYYHMWRVKRKIDCRFDDGFHLANKIEAIELCDFLNKRDNEFAVVTKERDEATDEADATLLRLGKTQERMFDAEMKLAAVTKERDELKSLLTRENGCVTISRNGYVQELEQQRDALAEALREMQYGHTDKAERMANEALATLNHP